MRRKVSRFCSFRGLLLAEINQNPHSSIALLRPTVRTLFHRCLDATTYLLASPLGPEKADHRFADLGHDNTHSSPEPTLVAESSRDGYMRSLEALKVEFTQKVVYCPFG